MNEMEKFCTLIKGSSSGQLEGIGNNQDVEMCRILRFQMFDDGLLTLENYGEL